MSNDIVLDIEGMKRVGPKLGEQVTLTTIKDGMHDLFLSQKEVREDAFKQMFSWLSAIETN